MRSSAAWGGGYDLIYLDPPFNSNRNYSAPIGSEAAGAAFKDAWTLHDYDAEWLGLIADEHPALAEYLCSTAGVQGRGTQAYLIYMAVRLIELRRVLKPTGSIYLHVDPTASHYLKIVMDCIFGDRNFRNEIAWCYAGGGASKRGWGRKHDIIFWYSNGGDWVFNADSARIPYASNYQGTGFGPNARVKNRQYTRNKKGKVAEDWWTGISRPYSKERTGYPTQKPLALLRRIILASSNEGDIVLDPFCGCATACVAAQDTGRKWVGIDISLKALELINRRFNKELGLISPEIIHRTDIPQREGKLSKDIKHILYGQQEGLCTGCEHYFHFRNMTKDHVVPTSKGGANSDDNLQLLCGACNSLKGNRKTMPELRAELHKQGILRAA